MMTIFGLGSSLGGPLSGYLSDVWDWRLSFWVQVPSILWCAVVVGTFLPEPVLPPTHTNVWSGLASLDWVGIGLLLGSTSALLGGFSAHTSFFRPWSHISVWGLLTAALVGIVLFIGVEKRVKHPIVPLRLFTPRLAAIWVSGLLLSVASQAFLFHVPSYFAVLLNSTATQAGMVVSVCSGLGLSTGSLFAG
jgi:predicted MFS family arabinose efflux permease